MLQLNYKLTDEDYIEFNEFHQLIHSEIGKRNLFFLRLIGPMISILAMIIFILARAEVMLIIGEAIVLFIFSVVDIVEVTYACKMGCTHCLSDCKPDGEHMTLEVFEDVLKFMIKNQIPTWSFSGGEMFEHPDILKMLSLIESYWKTLPIKYPITFATNGRELVRNKKIYHAVSEFLKHCGKRYVMIQVTDDPRFYPDPLTDNEK